jgi:hypothetical protein
MAALVLLTNDVAAASVQTALAGDGMTTVLTSVQLDDGRMQRPGVELIGGSVFHLNFNSDPSGNTISLLVPSAVAAPSANTRAAMLLGDAGLNTGIMNIPAGIGLAAQAMPTANDLGMGFFFDRPVVNGPGPDMILFDYVDSMSQSADGVQLSALSGSSGYNSLAIGTGIFSATQFSSALSIAKTSRYQQANPIQSLADFETKALSPNNPSPFPPIPQNRGVRWLMVDFADLGVGPFDNVDGIFLQSMADANFDPVFIAGFTPVPEPATLSLGLGALAILFVISRGPGSITASRLFTR